MRASVCSPCMSASVSSEYVFTCLYIYLNVHVMQLVNNKNVTLSVINVCVYVCVSANYKIEKQTNFCLCRNCQDFFLVNKKLHKNFFLVNKKLHPSQKSFHIF